MKKLLTGVIGAGALLALMAVAQDDAALQSLRTAVANLGLRVDRLESAAGGDGAINAGATNANPARKMVMMSVHNTTNPNVNTEEIADLKQQCAALMNTINNKADAVSGEMSQAAGAGGVSYQRGGVDGYDSSGGGYERGGGGGGGGEAGEARGDMQIEQRYATIRTIKMQKLQALEDAANKPTQIIIGHDGNTVITLQSKVDLTSALNNIPIGATVTWNGTRTAADDNSETWKIDSISLVKAP